MAEDERKGRVLALEEVGGNGVAAAGADVQQVEIAWGREDNGLLAKLVEQNEGACAAGIVAEEIRGLGRQKGKLGHNVVGNGRAAEELAEAPTEAAWRQCT